MGNGGVKIFLWAANGFILDEKFLTVCFEQLVMEFHVFIRLDSKIFSTDS